MRVTAIVPAAGSGSRMGGAEPKQYLRLAGMPLLSRTLLALTASGCLDHLVLVVPPGQETRCREELLDPYGISVERLVPGGADRQASVGAGLAAAPADSELILVHDGARPLVTAELIRETLAAAAAAGAAAAAVPVTDTIKRADEAGTVLETPRRGELWAAQTPQAFRADLLREAHRRAQADGFRGTDDSALVERLGVPVRLVPGSRDNLKITTALDLVLAEALLRGAGEGRAMAGTRPAVRAGIGFDMHRLVAGRPLILGGVAVPFDRGLEGDSDADVLSHAILDALLGAAAAGDIGSHFGVGRPEMMGISSLLLLERTMGILAERGYRPSTVDATLVAERPRLSPHLPTMREKLARVLSLPADCVNIKTTTAKGLGPLGAGEGIAAHAVALVVPLRAARPTGARRREATPRGA